MDTRTVLRHLDQESTWKLFFLSAITPGIYSSHYIKRQTAKLNTLLEPEDKISSAFFDAILVVSYAAAILVIPYLVLDDGRLFEIASRLLDRVCSILVIVWGFKARNRMNALLHVAKDDAAWFHGGGIFFFTTLYFNYKLNLLREGYAGETSVPEDA